MKGPATFESSRAYIRMAIHESRNKHFAWWLGRQSGDSPKQVKKLIDGMAAADNVEPGADDLINFALNYCAEKRLNLTVLELEEALDTANGAAEMEIIPNKASKGLD